MGSIVADQDYRPALNARLEQVRHWYTTERFRGAWLVAKLRVFLSGSNTPTAQLMLDLSRSPRAVYSWLAGEHDPDVLSLARIDKVFSDVIGEDWMVQTDTFLL